MVSMCSGIGFSLPLAEPSETNGARDLRFRYGTGLIITSAESRVVLFRQTLAEDNLLTAPLEGE